MNCDRVQAAISERMDGEYLGRRVGPAVDHHLEGCARCRAFERDAHAVRSAVRIRPAEDIPDLTDKIMASVRQGTRANVSVRRRERRRPAPKPVTRSRRYAPAAAALVVGLVAGSLAVGGPWQRPSGHAVAAAEVVSGVRAAAHSVRAFEATFAMTERGLPGIGEREFSMDVWFRAPTRYRLRVVDHTAYPSAGWHPTNITFIANGPTTYRVGAKPCPFSLGVSICSHSSEVTRSRTDFSSAAPLPADLITPLDVLSSTHGLAVTGTETVLGRPAVEVQLPFSRAEPLFPFLRLGGTWRPFYAQDTVSLWLDRSTWFPLRYTVTPSAEPARNLWATRYSLPEESPSEVILDVRATSFDNVVPPRRRFEIPGTKGFRQVPVSTIPTVVKFQPVVPTATADLPLSSAVVPTSKASTSSTPQTLLTYSSGLTYLRVGERKDWSSGTLFGPVSDDAQRITLPSGSVAYYEPPSGDHDQRLAIHAAGTNLYLETNLPRDELLQVADSLPVHGTEVPSSWLIHRGPLGPIQIVSLQKAEATLPFTLGVPASLPEGYLLQSVELTQVPGAPVVDLTYARSDGSASPILIHEERGAALPPAPSADSSRVDVAGVPGRWTPLADPSTGSAARLQWVRGGVVFSIDTVGLSQQGVLAIAASIPVAG